MWKKRIQFVAWSMLAALVVVLLVAAVQKKNSLRCREVHVEIEGAEEHVFVDEKHLLKQLEKMGADSGAAINSINLRWLETKIERDAWIKNAELYFDNNRVLQVKIEERQPLARVFTVSGSSFYIDSAGTRLPLSERQSARVPVFTSFPSDRTRLAGADSVLLLEVKMIAQTIARDSFWTDLVSQVDITPQRTYQMIPQLGNQTIVLGTADNLDDKLTRLYSFYRQVWAKAGFEKYERIDVQYAGQVVATRKGAAAAVADSAKALQQLNTSIAQANSLGAGAIPALPSVPGQAAAAKRDTANATGATRRAAVRQTANPPKPSGNNRPAGRRPRAVMPGRH